MTGTCGIIIGYIYAETMGVINSVQYGRHEPHVTVYMK